MESNIDLKNIWHQQKTEEPEMKEILDRLKKYKKTNLRKLIITNIILSLTCGIVIFVWVYYQPEFVSTKIGIVLILLAIAIFLLFYNKLSTSLKKIDHTDSNQGYIVNLKTYVIQQKFIQNTLLSLYFVMLSVGISLYMYEYAVRMTLLWGVLSYLITFFWLGFNWFYTRPKVIKKQQLKLDGLINKFESINQQLKQEF